MKATIDTFVIDSRSYLALAYVRNSLHQGDCRIKPEFNTSLAKTNGSIVIHTEIINEYTLRAKYHVCCR